MVMPAPDYTLTDPGNYSGSGTVAHAHRSFTLGGAGYDLSSAPDGTLVLIWASLGHEHNDIDLTPGEVVGKVYTGNVTEYTGDPTTLTEVTGWSTTAWNVSVPSSVIIVHGWVFYATLGDGTGGTIDKSLFTETDGSGNSELCIEYSGGVTYPQTDSWVTPIVYVFEPNAGNNAVVDVADIQDFEGTGDPSTLNIASFTTNQDDTLLILFGESIAGTWDNNDPSPGAWTDEGSGDGGYSQVWELEVASAGTVAAQSVTNQNSGQPDGHVGCMVPVYYEAGTPAATVTGHYVEGRHETPGGSPTSTQDVKFQTGSVDVTADGQTVTLPTSVGSLDNAFVFIAGNRHQGAGPVGSASTQHADDMGVVAELTAVDTITFGYDGGNGSRVQWVVMEYVGAPGGDNEFIVRGRHNFTFTSDTNQTTALTTAPTDVNKVIPFIRGISSSHASAGANNLGARAWMSNTGNTLNVACSQEDDTTTVGITAVEFTGSNWSVGHMAWNGATSDGPIDRPLVQEADGDSGGTSFDVGDWATAAIVSWGHASDDANEAIADGWPLWEPTPASTTEVRWTFDSDHDGADDDYVVHVLQHDDMAVTRYSDTSSAADETTVDVTSAGLTDLARSLVLGTSITSGSGTAYGRGWRVYYLNSLTEAAHWSHRSGNTMAHRIQVIDFADVVSSSAPTPAGDVTGHYVDARHGAPALTVATVVTVAGHFVAAAHELPTGTSTPAATVAGHFVEARHEDPALTVVTALAPVATYAEARHEPPAGSAAATGSPAPTYVEARHELPSATQAANADVSATYVEARHARPVGTASAAGSVPGHYVEARHANPVATSSGTASPTATYVEARHELPSGSSTATATIGGHYVEARHEPPTATSAIAGTVSSTYVEARHESPIGQAVAVATVTGHYAEGRHENPTGSTSAAASVTATYVEARHELPTVSTAPAATISTTYVEARHGQPSGTATAIGSVSATYVEARHEPPTAFTDTLTYVSDADVSRVDPVRTAARATLTVRTARRADPVRTGAVPWDL